MLKELGLVVTGFAVGVGVTLYYTKDLIVAGVTHTLADVFEEELEDAKDHKRDYTKPPKDIYQIYEAVWYNHVCYFSRLARCGVHLSYLELLRQ